eukprot:5891168-Amphidinium_carterae.1
MKYYWGRSQKTRSRGASVLASEAETERRIAAQAERKACRRTSTQHYITSQHAYEIHRLPHLMNV